jgi:ribosomal-protein-alanine N-acetyltransferase
MHVNVPISLETERIRLTRLSQSHASFIHELMNTPDWIEFIGDRKIDTITAASDYIKKIDTNPDVNFWLITEKVNNIQVGVITLIKKAYLEFPDIGFALLPAQYKRGFAHEGSKLILDIYFSSQESDKILATSLNHNKRSISLLLKLGFLYQEEIFHEGNYLSVYSMDKSS